MPTPAVVQPLAGSQVGGLMGVSILSTTGSGVAVMTGGSVAVTVITGSSVAVTVMTATFPAVTVKTGVTLAVGCGRLVGITSATIVGSAELTSEGRGKRGTLPLGTTNCPPGEPLGMTTCPF